MVAAAARTRAASPARIAGTVPVYYGPRTLHKIAPGVRSYIDARDFSSAEALAAHLLAVAGDEERYAGYHAWRAGPVSPGFARLRRRSWDSLKCRTCLFVAGRKLDALQ